MQYGLRLLTLESNHLLDKYPPIGCRLIYAVTELSEIDERKQVEVSRVLKIKESVLQVKDCAAVYNNKKLLILDCI
jgi:hypothetical protein